MARRGISEQEVPTRISRLDAADSRATKLAASNSLFAVFPLYRFAFFENTDIRFSLSNLSWVFFWF